MTPYHLDTIDTDGGLTTAAKNFASAFSGGPMKAKKKKKAPAADYPPLPYYVPPEGSDGQVWAGPDPDEMRSAFVG